MASSPDNVITGTSSPDFLEGANFQNDLIIGFDTLEGDIGTGDNDTIVSSSGEDTAVGGNGDDSIAFFGNDHASISGGEGNDTVFYDVGSFGESTISGG